MAEISVTEGIFIAGIVLCAIIVVIEAADTWAKKRRTPPGG